MNIGEAADAVHPALVIRRKRVQVIINVQVQILVLAVVARRFSGLDVLILGQVV